MAAALALLALLAAPAVAGDEAAATGREAAAPTDAAALPDAPYRRTGWGFGGVPALNYNSDDGFGYGILGTVYRYDGHTAPYSSATTFQVFMTTKQVHSHKVVFDAVDAFGLPLRINAKAQLEVYRTANFCGFGPEVSCDPEVAASEAEALGLSGEDAADFEHRYYLYRYVRPNGYLQGRWKLREEPAKVEVFGGWRGAMHLPGDLQTVGPYPGSLYAEVFPEGEKGFLSVLQVGLMGDTRDFEPAPTHGWWVEGSVRGGGPWIGSRWSYFGYNLTARNYLPLARGGRLSLANRLVHDGIVGDVPTQEMTTVGGSTPYSAWGGQDAGRGIRWARYIGRFKLFEQAELRWRFVDFAVARVPVALSLHGFADVGVVGEDWCREHLAAAFGHLLPGEGGGLRVAIDENFIIRADVGVSALEDWAPGIYINVGNLY